MGPFLLPKRFCSALANCWIPDEDGEELLPTVLIINLGQHEPGREAIHLGMVWGEPESSLLTKAYF